MCQHLPCSSLLKIFHLLFRVGSMHVGLWGEPRSLYTTLWNCSLELSPICKLPDIFWFPKGFSSQFPDQKAGPLDSPLYSILVFLFCFVFFLPRTSAGYREGFFFGISVPINRCWLQLSTTVRFHGASSGENGRKEGWKISTKFSPHCLTLRASISAP